MKRQSASKICLGHVPLASPLQQECMMHRDANTYTSMYMYIYRRRYQLTYVFICVHMHIHRYIYIYCIHVCLVIGLHVCVCEHSFTQLGEVCCPMAIPTGRQGPSLEHPRAGPSRHVLGFARRPETCPWLRVKGTIYLRLTPWGRS